MGEDGVGGLEERVDRVSDTDVHGRAEVGASREGRVDNGADVGLDVGASRERRGAD